MLSPQQKHKLAYDVFNNTCTWVFIYHVPLPPINAAQVNNNDLVKHLLILIPAFWDFFSIKCRKKYCIPDSGSRFNDNYCVYCLIKLFSSYNYVFRPIWFMFWYFVVCPIKGFNNICFVSDEYVTFVVCLLLVFRCGTQCDECLKYSVWQK